MDKKKFNKKECSCGKKGLMWYNERWWCQAKVDFGEFNLIGVCPKEEKK